MPEKLLKILRFMIICCLIFSFVVQILESFEKFLAGRSSFSTRMELKVYPGERKNNEKKIFHSYINSKYLLCKIA